MTFGERLVHARELVGLNQKQLADLLEISPTRLNYWEKDKRQPDVAMIKKIASALRVTGDYLIGLCDTSDNLNISEHTHINKYRLLDHYGKEAVDTILDIEYKRSMDALTENETDEQIIYLSKPIHVASAGTGDWNDDNSTEPVAVVYNAMTSKADYVITVAGNSMEPLFSDGDLVLVRSQPSVEIGEIGIYIIAGDQYIKEYQGTHLHSINPEFQDIPWQEGTICRGKVICMLDEAWVR